MQSNRSFARIVAVGWALATLASPDGVALRRAGSSSAELRPARIALDEAAMLRVGSDGQSAAPPRSTG